MNCGLASIACSAVRMPLSKSCSLRARLVEPHQALDVVAAHRAAERLASRAARTICSAHGASSAGVVGRQMKTRRRLTVSDTPVTLCGPVTANSRRCGSVVTPSALPICVSASV